MAEKNAFTYLKAKEAYLPLAVEVSMARGTGDVGYYCRTWLLICSEMQCLLVQP